jgi:enterochelin esterase-like enzyme
MLFSHLRADGSALFFAQAPHAHDVRVTGSFLGWDASGRSMQRTDQGFAVELPIGRGEHEYKFVIDGRWQPDPLNLRRGAGDNSLLSSTTGTVSHLEFHSPALGERRRYVAYLPPGHTSGKRFPVLYLLHGALDWERTWLDKGALVDTVEGLRAAGAIGDLIVVMPSENGNMFRSDTRVADYLARDVVGHVDYEFPTLADPRHRALDGLSTGGFTSVLLGAWRPHVFGSIGSMSGCHDPRTFQAIADCAPAMREAGQRHLVSAGHAEPHLGTCRGVHEALQKAGVHSEWLDAPGHHDWPLWRAILGRHLAFHWRNVG